MRIERELVDAEKAALFLTRNSCNRPVSNGHVDKLARSMSDGEWYETHQGIAFDVNGMLIDGQHRLLAIVKSKTKQWMYVAYDVDVSARGMIDNQFRPRSIRDSLVMDGFDLSSKESVAIARMWMYLLGQTSPSVHEVKWFIIKNESHIRFAIKVAGGNKILRHGCVSAMIAVASSAGHAEEMRRWCEVVASGIVESEWQSSAIRFRDWWMTSSHNGGASRRLEYCQRIYASMHAWIERRGLTKLYARQVIDWLEKGAD